MLCHKFHVRAEARWLLTLLSVMGIIYVTRCNLNKKHEDIQQQDSLPEKWQLSPLWVEDQRPHSNPHRFRYLANQPDLCDGEDVDLLIMVASATGHGDAREAIRQTWGSPKNLRKFNSKLIFLLGQGSEKQFEIAKESDERKDIIQEDFKDTYRNLTLKTVMGLKWSAIFCPQAKFVMKTDDDIFVNLPLLHSAIKSNEGDFSKISGCIKNGPQSAPQPIPSPGQSLLQPPPAHPAFTAGAGYVLPGSIVQDLYVVSLGTALFPVEDVFTTAHCARRIGVHPPRHDGRFSCGQMVAEDDCEMARMFTGHKVTTERQFALMESLEESGRCSKKKNKVKRRVSNRQP